MIKVLLVTDVVVAQSINAHASVEAEYGDVVVKGSRYTLAHHTGEYKDNDCPCLMNNLTVEADMVQDEETILLSHIDWDAIGGVFALCGIKQEGIIWDAVWDCIAFSDTNGKHMMHKHFMYHGTVKRMCDAMWAYSERNKYEPTNEINDVTTELELAHVFLEDLFSEVNNPEGDTPLLDMGETWDSLQEAENIESISAKFTIPDNTVILRSSTNFVNHLYWDGNGTEFKAVVAWDISSGSITLSFIDDVARGELNACDIMQEVFSNCNIVNITDPENEKIVDVYNDKSLVPKEYFNEDIYRIDMLSGGHPGIAGTPRGVEFKYSDAYALAELVAARLSV